MNDNKIKHEPLTLSQINEAAQKRVAVIAKEFAEGFRFISNYPRSVTFFGSARIKENEHYYEKARSIAHRVAEELHYSVVTGGGPGIMKAANRGAYEGGGNSIGLNIQLPNEQKSNEYLTDQISFHYFFSRKVCLSFSAEAYIFFPGGFGTLDEFLEILTLVQTGKIPKVPMILVGVKYWTPLQEFFKDTLIKEDLIEKGDVELYTITDDDDEIIEIIKNAPVRIGMEYNQKSEEPIKKNNHNGVEGPMTELYKKHCVPCEGTEKPLSHEKSEELLKEVSEWTLFEDKEIEKTYDFKDFSEAMRFVNSVARVSEIEGHHPDIKIRDYKKVDVRISTHAINGLSENDFILAAKIDELIRDKKF